MEECPPPVPAVPARDIPPGPAFPCPLARDVPSARKGGRADKAAACLKEALANRYREANREGEVLSEQVVPVNFLTGKLDPWQDAWGGFESGGFHFNPTFLVSSLMV